MPIILPKRFFDAWSSAGVIDADAIRREVRKKYYEKHACCPVCGSGSIETTCIGYVSHDLFHHEDSNDANCRCGWRGVVNDLVESGKSERS